MTSKFPTNWSRFTSLLIAFIAVFVVLVSFNKTFAANTNQSDLSAPHAKNQIIVGFEAGTTDDQKNKIHRSLKTSVLRNIPQINAQTVKIPNGKVADFINKFKALAGVRYAEPNYKVYLEGLTNDPELPRQEALYKSGFAGESQTGWNITTGNSNVKIGLVDSGIKKDHPDISGKVLLETTFTDDGVGDGSGHGTYVGGFAAAQSGNGLGIAGAGYKSSIISAKIFNNSGESTYDGMVNAIIWTADKGAKVINLSLSASTDAQSLRDAVNYAWNKGAVLVASAGNYSSSTPRYPAGYDRVIAVAATDLNDVKKDYSNYGSWVDVAAPADGVYTTKNDNGYGYVGGTSLSAPQVSGLAALIWATNKCSTNQCVVNLIQNNTDPIAQTGTYWRYGRINAYKALTANAPIPTNSPTPTRTPTSSPKPCRWRCPTPTRTPTRTPTPTLRPTITVTPTPGPTVIISPTRTLTPTPTPNCPRWKRSCN